MSSSRRRPKIRASGSPAFRIASLLRMMKRRRYGSLAEYYSKLSAATDAFGNAAAAISQIEASHMAAHPGSSLPKRRTLWVSPTGDPGQDFPKIQSAIDHASPGDRILLKSGVFRSAGVVWIWKDIALQGEPGTIIEGTLHHGGKAIADPAANGGFIIVGNPEVEMQNLHFRHLYFAVASHGGLGRLVFEDNSCEDVYHSVYISAGKGGCAELIARCNRVIISSLNPLSSRCRFNFYEESHLFGFYCDGNVRAVLEANHLEVKELTGSQPFHAIGVFCSGGSAVVRDNFFKGWHAPITLHGISSPIIHRNSIHGVCEDSEYKPIAISLRDCEEPVVLSNSIMSRGLGSEATGIVSSGSRRGRIIDNRISLGQGANSGILVYRSNGMLVGQNSISDTLKCPIGLFGDQSEDVRENIIFSNNIEGPADIKLAYASGNTILGRKGGAGSDSGNALMGYEVEVAGEMPARLDQEDASRHQRIFDHLGRKAWPAVPDKYSQKGEHDEEK